MTDAVSPALTGGGRPRLIDRYRRFLPITDATPNLSLGEGGTPLVRAERLGTAIGAFVRRDEPAESTVSRKQPCVDRNAPEKSSTGRDFPLTE